MAKLGRKKLKPSSRIKPKLSDRFPWHAKASRKARLKARGSTGPAASPSSVATSTEDANLVDVDRPPTGPRPHVGYDTERAAYGRMRADLLRQHEGLFVVFVGAEMIGPFDDFHSALEGGYRTFGSGPLYIKHVLEEDPVAESGTALSCRS